MGAERVKHLSVSGFADARPANPIAGIPVRREGILLLLGENSPVGFCTTENSRKPRPYTAESPAPETHPDGHPDTRRLHPSQAL